MRFVIGLLSGVLGLLAGWLGLAMLVIAKATFSRKTSRRVVTLELPGVPAQTWQVGLPSDPDPTPGFSPWRTSSGTEASKIEMNFSLSAER